MKKIATTLRFDRAAAGDHTATTRRLWEVIGAGDMADGVGRRGRSTMAVKVIVELKARSGRRGELRSLIEQIATRDRPSGYHGSTYYASLDDPDLLIDIADWESPEARTTHLERAMAAGTYGPVLELLAGPFRATVVRRLP